MRAKILELIGGLPERRGPVEVKEFGSIEEGRFRIEKIAYESLPDFWVTANVYVPAGTGRFPAIILAPGHGPGKESQASLKADRGSGRPERLRVVRRGFRDPLPIE